MLYRIFIHVYPILQVTGDIERFVRRYEYVSDILAQWEQYVCFGYFSFVKNDILGTTYWYISCSHHRTSTMFMNGVSK